MDTQDNGSAGASAQSSKWWYSVGGERRGPVTFDDLRRMLDASQIVWSDLAWREGMPQWAPLQQIPELATLRTASAQATGTAAPATFTPASPIAYYGTASMPPRAVGNLKGHAQPGGDVGAWPLDDVMVGQFQTAMKLRRKVTSAAQLYRTLLFLAIIGAAALVISALVMFASTRSRISTAEATGWLVMGLFVCAFVAFYWVLWRFTTRSHRWAPLTFTLVALCLTLLQWAIALMGLARGSSADATGLIAGTLFTSLLYGAFIYVSVRAWLAIPQYLAMPAWCQELIVSARL